MSARQSIKRIKAKKPKTVSEMTRGRFTAPRSSITRQSIATGGWAPQRPTGELKFIDVTGGNNPLASSAAFTAAELLNGLQTGATATTRIGRKINLKSLYMRYTVGLTATSTGGCQFRILVVYDKQANGAACTITNVLLTDDFKAPNNLSYRDRFVVLADELTEPVSVQNNYQVVGTLFRKLNLEQMFNDGNAGDITDITTGSIYVFCAQSGGVGTGAPLFDFTNRIRFTDI